MAKIKARIIDRNRFTKKYPLVRAPKRLTYQGDANMELEVISVGFDNESEKDVYFESKYSDTNFRILVSPRDTTENDSAQVTLAVNDNMTSISGTRIEASAPFTGTADVIIIRIS